MFLERSAKKKIFLSNQIERFRIRKISIPRAISREVPIAYSALLLPKGVILS